MKLIESQWRRGIIIAPQSVAYLGAPCAMPPLVSEFLGVFINKLVKFLVNFNRELKLLAEAFFSPE